MGILAPHLVITFPYILVSSLKVSLVLNYWNTALLKPFDFAINDFYWFLDGIEFCVNLYFIERYNYHVFRDEFLKVLT